jgi:hypothetical protein
VAKQVNHIDNSLILLPLLYIFFVTAACSRPLVAQWVSAIFSACDMFRMTDRAVPTRMFLESGECLAPMRGIRFLAAHRICNAPLNTLQPKSWVVFDPLLRPFLVAMRSCTVRGLN